MKLAKKGKEKIAAMVWLFLFYMANPVFAKNKLEDLKIVSGSKKLLQDATVTAQGFAAGIIALVLIAIWIDYVINKDDRNQKSTIKLTVIIIIILMAILTVGEIIKILSGYYLDTPVDVTI